MTLSDSTGVVYDEQGLDWEKIAFIKGLKNIPRGRLAEVKERYPDVVYISCGQLRDNPLWCFPADCAFPCATRNEIDGKDASRLLAGGVSLVCEGSNMPSTSEAVKIFLDPNILYGPGKDISVQGRFKGIYVFV